LKINWSLLFKWSILLRVYLGFELVPFESFFNMSDMRIFRLFQLFILLFSLTKAVAQQKNYAIHTLAFYNFETFSIPSMILLMMMSGRQRRSIGLPENYQKLQNLSRVLLEIGSSENTNSPTFIGCSEIENRGVLEDLIKESKLVNKDYGIIHFDSPDKRGIDGLTVSKEIFPPYHLQQYTFDRISKGIAN
jgi:hypothetical protein